MEFYLLCTFACTVRYAVHRIALRGLQKEQVPVSRIGPGALASISVLSVEFEKMKGLMKFMIQGCC